MLFRLALASALAGLPLCSGTIEASGKFVLLYGSGANKFTFCADADCTAAMREGVSMLAADNTNSEATIPLCQTEYSPVKDTTTFSISYTVKAADSVNSINNRDESARCAQMNSQLSSGCSKFTVTCESFGQAAVVVNSEDSSSDSNTTLAIIAASVAVVLAGIASASVFILWRKAHRKMAMGQTTRTPQMVADNVNLNTLTWRGKTVENISQLSWEKMAKLEETESEQLSKIETLVFHFFPPNILPLIEARGLRASGLGQGGGGLSVSTSGPSAFGWEQNGGGNFRETVGKSLWGEKYRDVMSGGSAADKIDAIAFVKIPRQWQCTNVPGREDIRIVPKELLMAGHGSDFYLTPDRIKAVYFLFNPETQQKKTAQYGRGMDAAKPVDVSPKPLAIQVGRGTGKRLASE